MNNLIREPRLDEEKLVKTIEDSLKSAFTSPEIERQIKIEVDRFYRLHPPETWLAAKKPTAELDSPGSDQHPLSVATLEVTDKFLAYKRAAGLQPRSIENYHQVLYSFARQYPVLPSKTEDIIPLLNSKPSGGTRLNIYKVLSAFYDFASQLLGINNIMLSVQKPKVKPKEPACLTLSQLLLVLAAIETDRERALVFLYVGQGLRLSEALRLDIKDIGEDMLSIKGKERDESMPLLPEVRDALLKLAGNRGPDEPVFVGQQGRLGRDMAEENIKRLFKRAGVVGIQQSPKIFRSTFGSMMLNAGCDYYLVKRLLRHSSGWDVTHRHYIHLNNEELRRALEKYSPLRLAQPGFGQTTGR